MSLLPDTFASPAHLPFNRSALEKKLRLASPHPAPDQAEGRWLGLRGTELILERCSSGLRLPAGPLPPIEPRQGQSPLFLGHWEGQPCRIFRVERETELPSGYAAANLLAAEPQMPIDLLSLGGLAGQALHWNRTSRRCSLCGGDQEWLPGEWGKRCLGCGYSHYPHIHPCVIVLVKRPGEVLLTRKADWPAGRYSLVAGFLDLGECLEEAVAREVLEETGVEVDNVNYVGSQCWPFPSQLMAGFTADYRSGELQVDLTELEDARWFALDDLPQLPPRRSIARYILDTCT